MASLRHALLALTTFNFVLLARAGPLGPLPNVTSSDLGLKEGSCAVGDVVYLPGDEFPGSSPCEKCTCTDGSVQCTRQVCEPRPGCKALHRPDQCCPTYQCECEQEGRVYGNGEKLVDPADPCRVCYCQGGEVVCRRIACFVRDDCSPRLVPGRCCPEYDNCPLRGVTSLPGLSSATPSVSTSENFETPVSPPKENIKQEITIKEITPVSEIPVITEVKIKEILPSPSIEVAEYSSSKSPLIPREATSEKNVKDDSKTESPSVVEVHFSSSSQESTQYTASESKDGDALPSKISFSTQDSIHSSIYPSKVPIVALMGVPVTSEPLPVATTKAPMIEEEDTFDHNPAFPPLPDDLAVLRNHEDEIVPEVVVDNEHVPSHDIVVTPSPPTEAEVREPETSSTTKDLPDTTTTTTKETPKETTEVTTPQPEISTESPTLNLRSAITTEILNSPSLAPEEINGDEKTTVADVTTLAAIGSTGGLIENTEGSTESKGTTAEVRTTTSETRTTSAGIMTTSAESRSTSAESKTTFSEASSTSSETRTSLAESSSTSAEVKTSSESFTSSPATGSTTFKPTETTPEESTKEQAQTTSTTSKSNVATEVTSQTELSSSPAGTSEAQGTSAEVKPSGETITPTPSTVITTSKPTETESEAITKEQEQISSTTSKSNDATDITSQTELSSLPVETSDQNPSEVSEQTINDKSASYTMDPFSTDTKSPLSSSEVITLSRGVSNENTGFENIETTEFILTQFGSSETATEAVELIKISGDPEKSAALIEADGPKKNNVLTDLIKLVSDVASISDHTDEPVTVQHATTVTLSDSEELIPVNAGYKSKNKNFNQNSITEVPFKSKIPNTVNKQKVIEIEDDGSEIVTDSLLPNDKMEPTTRRPIIDNVSDDNISNNKTNKKDIEIITQSYVPTINRRPTKVIMKKSNEKPTSDEGPVVSTSVETATDNETPLTTSAESSASAETSPAVEPSTSVEPFPSSGESETSATPQQSTVSEASATTEQAAQ